jgi:NAD(P)-dependent dehydrogenase (short-subunit alcohol dehydrogenase family)
VKRRSAFVTGCSSGIGRATVLLLAARGYEVIASARNLADIEKLAAVENVRVTRCDVSDEDSVRAAIEFAARDGKLDLIVNNAGYALVGPVVFADPDQARAEFEVNTFGPVRVIRRALPFLLKSDDARTIQVSSIGGRVHVPLAGWYTASKFALEGLNDALRFELEPLGIKVVSILPGPVLTEFMSKLKVEELPADAPELCRRYMAHYAQRRGGPRRGAVSAEVVAQVILRAAECRRPRARYVVTAPAKLFNVARKFVPDRAWDYLTKRVYGFDKVELRYRQAMEP